MVCIFVIASTTMAQDIISFDNGNIVFSIPNTNLFYTIESRHNLTNGVWDGSYQSLKGIRTSAPTASVAIGRYFRIVGSNTPPAGNATGNATVDQVLSGATFSTSTGTSMTGAMPNIGQQIITPGTSSQAITLGYHNGSGIVAGSSNLVPANIRNGVILFGVTGSYVGGSLDPRFIDNGDGTVTDTATSLMWIKKPHWLPGNFDYMNWYDAVSFCNDLIYAGHSDWRLPHVNRLDCNSGTLQFFELNGICRQDGDIAYAWKLSIITNSFVIRTNNDYYWSGTCSSYNDNYSYRLYARDGSVADGTRTIAHGLVWPVRSTP